eukprot:TRINITY_DN623_c0_g1_i1.p1 TRINITY_DN623_c0_g1~~TRINITY_DN623_c0_g1_i1.p1  ORF type:complete len:743 (+),score=87.92 TRINITY_DN623_c0_g1_i1:23-2230(+)
MQCQLKVNYGGKLVKAGVPCSEPGFATVDELAAWCRSEWGSGFTLTKVICSGKVVGDGGKVKGSVMVFGVDRGVKRIGERSGFVGVVDVMSCVFSFIPLGVVKRVCIGVCRAWWKMAELATRHHPHRYLCESGHLFDVFKTQPKQLFDRLGVLSNSILDTTITEDRLYVLSDAAPPPPTPDPHNDDEELSDDDDVSMASSSGSDGDEDETPAQKDAHFKASLGLLGVSTGLSPSEILPVPSAPATLRSLRVSLQKIVRRQKAYKLHCIHLMKESLLWTAESLFTRDFNTPITGLGSTSMGAIVTHRDIVILYDKHSGIPIRDFARPDGWVPLFAAPFWVPTQALEFRNSRKHGVDVVVVPQGDTVHILRKDLEQVDVFKLPVMVFAVELVDLKSNRVVVTTVDREICCISLSTRKVLWREADTRKILHYSETNTLLSGLLIDSEGSHFAMPISSWNDGIPLALLEASVQNGQYAEAVFVQINITPAASPRSRFSTFPPGTEPPDGTYLPSDEELSDILMTDTTKTMEYATNASVCVLHPEYEQVLGLGSQAPPRVVYDKAQDFNSPHNVEARRYAAFNRKYADTLDTLKKDVWARTLQGCIALKAICREVLPKAKSTDPDAIKRTLKEIWSVPIPFSQATSISSAARQGNMLYVALSQHPTIGVYGIAVDRGFVKWKRLWEQSTLPAVTSIVVNPLQGVLAVSIITTGYTFLAFFDSVSGEVRHTAKVLRQPWYN